MFWFKRKKWVHVCAFKTTVSYYGYDAPVYIHLYESADGSRKAEFKSGYTSLSDTAAGCMGEYSAIYQEKVVRWLGGRADINIPRYSECAADDVANALKGKIG